MRNVHLGRGFQKWRMEASTLSLTFETAKKLRRAINVMQKRHLSMAFNKWREEAALSMMIGRTLRHAVIRMRTFRLRMAFEAWQETYEMILAHKKALADAA